MNNADFYNRYNGYPMNMIADHSEEVEFEKITMCVIIMGAPLNDYEYSKNSFFNAMVDAGAQEIVIDTIRNIDLKSKEFLELNYEDCKSFLDKHKFEPGDL